MIDLNLISRNFLHTSSCNGVVIGVETRHKVSCYQQFPFVCQRSDDVSVSGSTQGTQPTSSECYEQYSLRVEMLPNYLPTRVLHKILFIGESVDMFENNSNMDGKSKSLNHSTQASLLTLSKSCFCLFKAELPALDFYGNLWIGDGTMSN